MTERSGTGWFAGRRRSMAIAGVTALAAVFTLTITATRATFSSQTASTSSWAAGSVTLGDDDSGSAMFTVSDIYPGRSESRCLRVSYTGNLPADVKLYIRPGDLGGNGLAAALKFTIEQGTGGSFADCSAFTPDSAGTLVNDEPLAITAANRSTVATGIGNWSPTGAQSKTYRFTYALADDSSVQGRTASVRFTWTASSS